MEHIAIDWGARKSQICVRTDDGTIVENRKVLTAELMHLGRRKPGRVIIETCTQAFSIADGALKMGHQVRVVPSSLAPALGIAEHGVKTDKRDAEALSRASCRIDLPSVHIPSEEARRRKSISSAREAMIKSRTMTVNAIKSWLRADGRSVSSPPESLPGRIRTVCEKLPHHVEQLVQVLELLNKQLKESEREIEKIAKSDPVCRRLMTVPGVGPMTAVRFQAAIDDRTRFSSAHKVESYLGLVPGEDSSSDRKRRLGITKAGPTALRAHLVQAAWAAKKCKTVPRMVQWSEQIAQRRGKHIATVALARKIAGILFAIWRDGTEYCDSRS